jgi:nitrous oxide reductase accessory protein NosL
MFVAKFPAWVVQVRHADDTLQFFDGVKDMMAWYFDPGRYGSLTRDSVKEIMAKDYYSLEWTDVHAAFFVTGSDVYGPMGHEFVPFSSKEAAAAFLKDHKGKQLVSFGEITEPLVESLRSGHRMR